MGDQHALLKIAQLGLQVVGGHQRASDVVADSNTESATESESQPAESTETGMSKRKASVNPNTWVWRTSWEPDTLVFLSRLNHHRIEWLFIKKKGFQCLLNWNTLCTAMSRIGGSGRIWFKWSTHINFYMCTCQAVLWSKGPLHAIPSISLDKLVPRSETGTICLNRMRSLAYIEIFFTTASEWLITLVLR